MWHMNDDWIYSELKCLMKWIIIIIIKIDAGVLYTVFAVKALLNTLLDTLLFSCDQAALQMVFSVCLSVRPSVCLSVCPSVRPSMTMFPSSYHEIFRSYYQWQKWRPCKRSRSEVKGQGHRGHNPTLPFPDCNSSLNSHMMMKLCI